MSKFRGRAKCPPRVKQRGMASLDPFEKYRRGYREIIADAAAKKAGPVTKKPIA